MFKINSKYKDEIVYNIQKDFPKEGVTFIDFMPTFMNIELISNICDELRLMINQITDKVDYVVAPESRGFILGAILAQRLGCKLLPVRKAGKIPTEFIGSSYTYDTEYSKDTLEIPKVDLKNKNCVFIDDVYALGGTQYACERLVESLGGKLMCNFCLYNVGLNENPKIAYILNEGDIYG